MRGLASRTQRPDRTGRPDFGTLIALGLGGGVALGAAFGALVIGMVLGLAAATAINAGFGWREGVPGGRAALWISVAGTAVAVTILLWS